jgi:hypothetical protein
VKLVKVAELADLFGFEKFEESLILWNLLRSLQVVLCGVDLKVRSSLNIYIFRLVKK